MYLDLRGFAKIFASQIDIRCSAVLTTSHLSYRFFWQSNVSLLCDMAEQRNYLATVTLMLKICCFAISQLHRMLKIRCFAISQALRWMMRRETNSWRNDIRCFAISQLHRMLKIRCFAKSQALRRCCAEWCAERLTRWATTCIVLPNHSGECNTTYVVLPNHSRDARFEWSGKTTYL